MEKQPIIPEKGEEKVVPDRLKPGITVSSIWTSERKRNRRMASLPKVAASPKLRLNPSDIPLEPIEYQEGKMGYDIKDLAPLMNLNPITLRSWIGFKVEGKNFPDGRSYIEHESLKSWLIRTAPRD